MVEYVTVEEARRISGLRLVLTAGVPGPWGEAAKGIFRMKEVPFVCVRQEGGGENRELLEWTGQTSAPVAVWNDERPRTTSFEILHLAERLAPEPRLIPASVDERALMLGMSLEIIGELGLGWCRRLMIFHTLLSSAPADARGLDGVRRMAGKYGYERCTAEAAPARVTEVLRALDTLLERQQRRRCRYFVGDAPTALDVYWATFATMLDPLPRISVSHALCEVEDRQVGKRDRPAGAVDDFRDLGVEIVARLLGKRAVVGEGPEESDEPGGVVGGGPGEASLDDFTEKT